LVNVWFAGANRAASFSACAAIPACNTTRMARLAGRQAGGGWLNRFSAGDFANGLQEERAKLPLTGDNMPYGKVVTGFVTRATP